MLISIQKIFYYSKGYFAGLRKALDFDFRYKDECEYDTSFIHEFLGILSGTFLLYCLACAWGSPFDFNNFDDMYYLFITSFLIRIWLT